MDHLLIAGGQIVSLLLAAGAGFWFMRLGTNWDRRMAGPLVLSFAAFMIGSVSWGDPTADGGFQPRVWLILGGGVLAGIALAKLFVSRRPVEAAGNENKPVKTDDS